MVGRDFEAREIQTVQILKWHKAEGEHVGYGDDLCDLKVQELRVPKGYWQVKHINYLVAGKPEHMVELARRELDGEQSSLPGLDPNAADPVTSSRCDFTMRMTSSDVGVVRSIYAHEGDRRKSGDVLALLSTDEAEPVDAFDPAAEQISSFRVVINQIPWTADLDGSPPFGIA
jgi:hypothetical protein